MAEAQDDAAAPAATRAARLATELGECRRRGLDTLDRRTHNQPPKELPELTALAEAYRRAARLPPTPRGLAIGRLLEDALAAYAAAGAVAVSQTIRELFFDPQQRVPPPRPGKLLEEAQERAGYGESEFRARRHELFGRFAVFLFDFVAAATRAAAMSPEPSPSPPPPPLPWWRRQPRWLIGSSIAAVVLVVIMGVSAVISAHAGSWPFRQSPPAAAASPTATFAPGQTWAEIAGQFGSGTFTDPYSPSTMGPRIEPYEQVQVACKVFAPSMPSMQPPDGYWYRLASPARLRGLYTPAGNFLNGDTVTGPRIHYSDAAVPACPS